MPTFKAPVYSKQPNAKGQLEPSYTFAVCFESSEDTLTYIAENASDISLQALQRCVVDNVVWWNAFISSFLQASSKLFSKPYTVEQLNKIMKHTLQGTATNDFPINVILLPTSIQIVGGVFLLHWKYICEPLVIDIMTLPEVTETNESIPDSNKVVEEFQELNIENVPMDRNATEETLELNNPKRAYDRQKVKEARLKAKLAMYKAQNELTRYYDKYGDDVTDSESESEHSDDEDNSDNGDVNYEDGDETHAELQL